MPKFFIVLEGPDGAGTSTQAKLLASRLKAEGHDVLFTREPTDGQYGQKIREATQNNHSLSPEELQKLFAQDRQEHVTKVIQPALDGDQIIVTDRYVPSSLIYGSAAGVSKDVIQEWNNAFPKPDLTIITLPPLDICLVRVGERKAQDAFEQEEFQCKVYAGYEQYIKEHPESIVIDTSKTPEENAEEVWVAVSARIKA
jgi:dTMP kinase